ncbi:MAG: hypothetical protein NC485_14505 [Ruminococcus flavefaciens]|nr:hypothetical protein [Ruminococcus flavefaciens]
MLENKLTADSPPKNRVIINSEIEFTDDDICCLLFGMNKEQLIKDICDNKSGKYDKLYVKEETA